jgi:hypothetical protein
LEILRKLRADGRTVKISGDIQKIYPLSLQNSPYSYRAPVLPFLY